MTGPSVTATPRPSDVSGAGYFHSHSGQEDHSWETDSCRDFFLAVAERTRSLTRAGTVLDVGCGRGLFVQALRRVGVNATGFDSTELAISSAHADVREFVGVGSLVDPIKGRYDLVSCVEVLEHIPDDQAQIVIDQICSVTDLVLFSSTPDDFDEPTHINVHPTADWAAAFAERGFYRRFDVNADFLSQWAVLFARTELSPRELVHRYETQHASLRAEVNEKREALLTAGRHLDATTGVAAGDLRAELDKQVRRTDEQARQLEEQRRLIQEQADRVVDAEHRQLTTRDHIIGLEATADEQVRMSKVAKARLAAQRERSDKLGRRLAKQRKRAVEAERRAQRAQNRANRLQAEMDALVGSRTWRWARRIRRPFGGR